VAWRHSANLACRRQSLDAGLPVRPDLAVDDLAHRMTDQVRSICLSLEDVTEKLSHGEPSWFVRGRQFAMMDTYHHGAKHLSLWLNAAPGAQEVLAGANPDLFFVPPYVGKQGWIGVRLDVEPDAPGRWDEIAATIADAYAASAAKAPKKKSNPAQ
jgi:hypothetical protein